MSQAPQHLRAESAEHMNSVVIFVPAISVPESKKGEIQKQVDSWVDQAKQLNALLSYGSSPISVPLRIQGGGNKKAGRRSND